MEADEPLNREELRQSVLENARMFARMKEQQCDANEGGEWSEMIKVIKRVAMNAEETVQQKAKFEAMIANKDERLTETDEEFANWAMNQYIKAEAKALKQKT